MSLYDDLAKCDPKIARGKVWCVKCGKSLSVDPARCFQFGWPKCCDATMTIDSPQWRAAHRKEPRE
jgi:hypothetical protein